MSHKSSRTVVSLNTRPKERRFKMLKPAAEINAINILDYYYARPSSFDTMSLYYSACWYIKYSTPNSFTTRQSVLERVFIPKYNVWFRKRKRFAIVRFPCFSVCNDDYYFTFLLLLLPHHSEIDLVCKYGCAKDAFSAKHSLLDFSMDMHNTFLLQV
ncbi:hypothetical protein MAR_026983 [Mya arenaria]|uniref:Uncharacterized protein n=1 Tax=Mya arenaria TaxID=6604 RepID=A0ABY7EW99_MYAAR|nr:hypothetical protein MAR_026983 [Mya arenaria]